MSHILDASALLAFLHDEPGALEVEPVLGTAGISSVNWSEVVQKALDRGVEVRGLRMDLVALGLNIVDFTAEDAEQAAWLWPQTRALGLSLGDRACLALGLRANRPVLSGDRRWATLPLGVAVLPIR